MRERGVQPEISLERNLESRRLSIDMALRRCQRKGWQPRDYFLRATQQMEQVPETTDTAQEVRRRLESLPDIDWATARREDVVDQVLEIAMPLLTAEFEQGRSTIEPAEHWQSAGIFWYEFYDPTSEPAMPELGQDPLMIIHIPSQADALTREKFFSSLQALAGVLAQHPEVKGIRGTSLLLEHPLFERLGFHIDNKHDEGPMASTFFPRQEFLEKFGK